MATPLIPIASGDASSAEFTLTDGQTATVGIKDASTDGSVAQGAQVYIQIKDDGGAFWTVLALTGSTPMQVISGPGTYRLRRKNNGKECGAFRG